MSPTPKQPDVARAKNAVSAVNDFHVFFIVFTCVLRSSCDQYECIKAHPYEKTMGRKANYLHTLEKREYDRLKTS